MKPLPNQKLDDKMKLKVVRLVVEDRLSAETVAERFGVSAKMIRDLVKKNRPHRKPDRAQSPFARIRLESAQRQELLENEGWIRQAVATARLFCATHKSLMPVRKIRKNIAVLACGCSRPGMQPINFEYGRSLIEPEKRWTESYKKMHAPGWLASS